MIINRATSVNDNTGSENVMNRVEKFVTMLGFFHIATSSVMLGLCGCAGLLLFDAVQNMWQDVNDEQLLMASSLSLIALGGLSMSIWGVLLSAPTLIASIGLVRHRRWGQVLTIVMMSVTALFWVEPTARAIASGRSWLVVTIGLATLTYCGGVLAFLLNPKVRAVFRKTSAARKPLVVNLVDEERPRMRIRGKAECARDRAAARQTPTPPPRLD